MAQNLQYPLDLSEDYKGKIQFKIASSKSTGAVGPAALRPEFQSLTGQITELNEFLGSSGTRSSNALSTTSVSGDGVTLYLPPGLQYRDNVSYEGTDLGMIGAFSEAGSGLVESFLENRQSFIDGLIGGATGASSELAKLAAVETAKLNPKALLGSGAAQGLEAAASARFGVTTNPNTRVLFKRVGLREFSFSFKLIAKSDTEATQIEEIVKFFRRQLYPTTFSLAGVGVGYKFPEPFNIRITYQGSKGKEGTWRAPLIKPSYLRDVGTTYNATTMSFHKDGKPMEVDLTLSFMESAALERQDIDRGF